LTSNQITQYKKGKTNSPCHGFREYCNGVSDDRTIVTMVTVTFQERNNTVFDPKHFKGSKMLHTFRARVRAIATALYVQPQAQGTKPRQTACPKPTF
jgi:hypothetical protein